MQLYAVITGDLINSSKLEEEDRDVVLKTLKKEFASLKSKYNLKFKFFRGDSFQGAMEHPDEALSIALILKSLLNKLELEKGKSKSLKGVKPFLDARISIGLGTVDFLRSSPEESDGEAFRNSGHSLDEMKKKGQRLIIKSPWEEINEEFETECKLLDALTEKWLTASAEAVYFLLLGYKEQEIAGILGVSQSAVNQRKKSANWEAIEFMLNRYKKILKNNTPVK